MKKWIDDNGKLLGLINPIDLGVILLLLLLAIQILSYYRPKPLQLKERPLLIGLAVKNVPPYLAKSITVGQDLFLDGTNAYIGKIYGIRTVPAEILLSDNGKVVLAQSPRNLDLQLRVRQNHARIITGPARSGVYINRLAIRVGDSFKMHTLYTSIPCEVESFGQ